MQGKADPSALLQQIPLDLDNETAARPKM